MTVSSTVNRKTFAGNGVTTSFATSPVVFFDTSDLVLTAVTDSTGASETLVENTDYTVTGGAGSTGTVSLAGGSSPYGAPAAGITLVIRRVLPLTQDDDFLNNDINDAEVLEDRLDRLTMIAQQLDEGNDLGVRLSSDETATDALTVLPFDRASKYLGFDASKELVALAAPTSTALTTAYSETLLAAANAAAARTILGAAGTASPTLTGPIVTTSAMDLQVGQIKFPATQNSSADANTLDDYEEGTWTPSLAGTSAVGYSVRNASYTKVGRLVHLTFALQTNGTITFTSPTARLSITGLPFSPGSVSYDDSNSVGSFISQGIGFNAGYNENGITADLASLEACSTTPNLIVVVSRDAGTRSFLNNSAWASSVAFIHGTVTYNI